MLTFVESRFSVNNRSHGDLMKRQSAESAHDRRSIGPDALDPNRHIFEILPF